jgi:hypothetical protein
VVYEKCEYCSAEKDKIMKQTAFYGKKPEIIQLV